MRNANCGVKRQQNESKKTLFSLELDADIRQRCSRRIQTEGRVGGLAALVVVVDEVTARSVRTQSGGVERPTEVGLVLGMSRNSAQLGVAVSELTSRPVAAPAALLELVTQLRLVALATSCSAGRGDRTRASRTAAAGRVCVLLISRYLRHLYTHKPNRYN